MAKAMIYRDEHGNELECILEDNEVAIRVGQRDDNNDENFIYLNKADLIALASDLTMLSKQLLPEKE